MAARLQRASCSIPELLAAVESVAAVSTPGTAAHEVPTGAIEAFREREAIMWTDWRPKPASPARLRRLRMREW